MFVDKGCPIGYGQEGLQESRQAERKASSSLCVFLIIIIINNFFTVSVVRVLTKICFLSKYVCFTHVTLNICTLFKKSIMLRHLLHSKLHCIVTAYYILNDHIDSAISLKHACLSVISGCYSIMSLNHISYCNMVCIIFTTLPCC